MLANLVENAFKYSSTGAAVEVAAVARDSVVLIEVTDTGSGIAREHHTTIFEKFGRVRDPQAQPGTGLGLFIARSIAEAHGGTLGVRSAPGRGSTFTLTLPVA